MYLNGANTQTETIAELNLLDVTVQDGPSGEGEVTRWIWNFDINPSNLTWINATYENGTKPGELKMINVAGEYWSDEKLSDSDAKDFICAEEIRSNDESYWVPFDCEVSTTHTREIISGECEIIGLSHPDPARRNGGTVFAQSISDAETKARDDVNHTHISTQWQIMLEIEGNNSDETPEIQIKYVNEEFESIEQFGLDTATEMLWSLAALFGCFAMLLVPSLSVYLAARYKETQREKTVLSILSDDEE